MNKTHNLRARQEATQTLIDTEMTLLQIKGYNPATRKAALPVAAAVNKDTPFLDACKKVVPDLKIKTATKKQCLSCLKVLAPAARKLAILGLPAGEVTRGHIKALLTAAQADRKVSASTFNDWRGRLMMLFTELEDMGVVDINPVIRVKKQTTVKQIKKILTPEERKKVAAYLQSHYPGFWRYLNIFYHSGCRSTELFALKKNDVNITEQYFTITIEKGKNPRQVRKAIKDVALPYWRDLLSTEGEWLFSQKFAPGDKPMGADRPHKLWRTVKSKLNIKSNFYAIKHLHTTEVSDLISQAAAAKHNSHTSEAMVRSIYDVRSHDRELEQLKRLNNKF